jgi:hypothetical protein
MRKFRELYQKRTPSNVPALPDNVDDNFYLASASKAAEIDKLSGAYDEFLFSEDGLTQMPYERAVDDHLALVEMRILDRGRRAVLIEKHKLIDAEAEVSKLLRREEAIQADINQREEKISDQAEILAGNKIGKSGVYWAGTAPTQTSLVNGAVRIAIPYLVYLFVALADLVLIFLSLRAIFIDTVEAFFFTIPALAIQVIFPHFIGSRISLLSHKAPNRKLLISELAFLTVVWITFAVTITEIRMQYIVNQDNVAPAVLLMLPQLWAGMFLMLIGLGTWLILKEALMNPHEVIYARLLFSINRLNKKLEKNRFKITKTTGLIPAIEASLDVAEKSYSDQIQAARNELAEAAKSVYRRALINQLGEVDFTSAYLGQGSSPSSSRAERRAKNDESAINESWRVSMAKPMKKTSSSKDTKKVEIDIEDNQETMAGSETK